jgi:hypothetical protein
MALKQANAVKHPFKVNTFIIGNALDVVREDKK